MNDERKKEDDANEPGHLSLAAINMEGQNTTTLQGLYKATMSEQYDIIGISESKESEGGNSDFVLDGYEWIGKARKRNRGARFDHGGCGFWIKSALMPAISPMNLGNVTSTDPQVPGHW